MSFCTSTFPTRFCYWNLIIKGLMVVEYDYWLVRRSLIGNGNPSKETPSTGRFLFPPLSTPTSTSAFIHREGRSLKTHYPGQSRLRTSIFPPCPRKSNKTDPSRSSGPFNYFAISTTAHPIRMPNTFSHYASLIFLTSILSFRSLNNIFNLYFGF